MNKRSYYLRVETAEMKILNAWNWFAETLNFIETGCVREFGMTNGNLRWERKIKTTVWDGRMLIIVEIDGSLGNNEYLLFQAKWALLAEVWMIYHRLAKDVEEIKKVRHFIQCMSKSVRWEEVKAEAGSETG